MVDLTKEEKKTLAKAASEFNLHVLLIVRQDGLSKAQSQVRAYLEGAVGLEKRLMP